MCTNQMKFCCCICWETFDTLSLKLKCTQCNEGRVCHTCVAELCLYKLQHVLSCPICQKKTTISVLDVGTTLNWVRLQSAFFMCTMRLFYLFVCVLFSSFVGWLVIGYTCACFISILS
jgi:hypothetical protein